jgi:hypothetical protein
MKELHSNEIQLLTNRIEALERRFRVALLAPAILLCVLIFAAWHTSAQRGIPQDVLTARQLVIVDEKGTKRVVIGAPAPDPIMGGKMQKRRSAFNGLILNDATGDERGGIGLMDDGTMTMCFDQNGRERVCSYVLPTGKAGVLINEPNGHDGITMTTEPQKVPEIQIFDDQRKPVVTLPGSQPLH